MGIFLVLFFLYRRVAYFLKTGVRLVGICSTDKESLLSRLEYFDAVMHHIKCLGRGHPLVQRWRAQCTRSLKICPDFDPLFILRMGYIADICFIDLVKIFRDGFPMIGRLSAPGIRPGLPEDFCISKGDLFSSYNDMWSDVYSSFSRTVQEEDEFLWQEAQSEVDLGWLGSPEVFAHTSPPPGCLPIRRFVVRQSRWRGRDDCKRGGVNSTSTVQSPIKLPQVSDLAECARRIGGVFNSVEFFKSDHASAHKQVPIREEHALLFRIVQEPCR